MIAVWLVLRFSGGIVQILRPGGIEVLTRIAGLLLAAIAVQLIADAMAAFVTQYVDRLTCADAPMSDGWQDPGVRRSFAAGTGAWPPARGEPSSSASTACRSGCSSARRASSARTWTARGATATPTSTGRPRRRGRRGRTTRSAPACTPRCGTGTRCRRPARDRRRWPALLQGHLGPRGLPRRRAGAGGLPAGAGLAGVLRRRRSTRTTSRVGVERVVAAKTAVLAFNGRADRIDRPGPDGELVIVDYKTGRTGLDADDARGSQALALYAYAAERVFRRPCRRVELHHLPTGTVAAHEHTEESLARHVARAEETAARHHRGRAGGGRRRRPGRGVPDRAGARLRLVRLPACLPGGREAPGKEPWAAMDGVLPPIGPPWDVTRVGRQGRCRAGQRGRRRAGAARALAAWIVGPSTSRRGTARGRAAGCARLRSADRSVVGQAEPAVQPAGPRRQQRRTRCRRSRSTPSAAGPA